MEGISLYFRKIFEMRDQLQELWDVMSDREMPTIVLNALPRKWGNFTSSIYSKKEATTLSEMWCLCKTKGRSSLNSRDERRRKEAKEGRSSGSLL